MNFRKCLRSIGDSVTTVDALFVVDGGFRNDASADGDFVVVVALKSRH